MTLSSFRENIPNKEGDQMSTITENKKGTLIDLLKQMESEISELYHCLEDDQSISNDKFKEYEKQIDKLFGLHTQLSEEIYFS